MPKKSSLLRPPKNPRIPTPPALDLYTIGETAAILGVSRRSVTNWIRDNSLPAIRLGPGVRLLRIRRTALEAFISRGELTPPHMRTPNVYDDAPGLEDNWPEEEAPEEEEEGEREWLYDNTGHYLPEPEVDDGHRR